MVSGFCESSNSQQHGSVVDCIICVIYIIYCVRQLSGDARTLFFDVRWRRSSKFRRILTSGVWILGIFGDFLGVIYADTSTNGSPVTLLPWLHPGSVFWTIDVSAENSQTALIIIQPVCNSHFWRLIFIYLFSWLPFFSTRYGPKIFDVETPTVVLKSSNVDYTNPIIRSSAQFLLLKTHINTVSWVRIDVSVRDSTRYVGLFVRCVVFSFFVATATVIMSFFTKQSVLQTQRHVYKQLC